MSSSRRPKRSASRDDEDDARSTTRSASSTDDNQTLPARIRLGRGENGLFVRRETGLASSSAAAEAPRPRASNLPTLFQVPELLGVVQEYSNLNDIANLSNAYEGVRNRTIPVPDWLRFPFPQTNGLRFQFPQTNVHEIDKSTLENFVQRLLRQQWTREYLVHHLFPTETAFDLWCGERAFQLFDVSPAVGQKDPVRFACVENLRWVECWTFFMQNIHPKIYHLLNSLTRVAGGEHKGFLRKFEVQYNSFVSLFSTALFTRMGEENCPPLCFSPDEVGYLHDEQVPNHSLRRQNRTRLLQLLSSKECQANYSVGFDAPRLRDLLPREALESFEIFVRFHVPTLFRFVSAAVVFLFSFYSARVEFVRVYQQQIMNTNLMDNDDYRTMRQEFNYNQEIAPDRWTNHVEFYTFLVDPPALKQRFYEHFITPSRIVNGARDLLRQAADAYFRSAQRRVLFPNGDEEKEKQRGLVRKTLEQKLAHANFPIGEEMQGEEKQREEKESVQHGPWFPSFDDYFQRWLGNRGVEIETPARFERPNLLARAVDDPRGPLRAREYESSWRTDRSTAENMEEAPHDFKGNANQPSNSGTQASPDLGNSVDSLVDKLDEVLSRFGK